MSLRLQIRGRREPVSTAGMNTCHIGGRSGEGEAERGRGLAKVKVREGDGKVGP